MPGGSTARVGAHTRPAAGAHVRPPFFSGDLLEHVDLQIAIGHHLLQAPVLLLELAQTLHVGCGARGGQRQYSDLAIETALTRRLIVHLPLRQTEGVLTSIFRMLGLDLSAPDHTTLSRRGQHLDLTLRRLPAGASMHLLVLSSCGVVA